MTNYNKDTPDERFGNISILDDADLIPRDAIQFTSVQGELKDAGIFTQMHTKLLLPESYEVVGIYRQPLRRIWSVIVKSMDIPLQEEENADLPEVKPIYVRNSETHHVQLVTIVFDTDPFPDRYVDSLHLLCIPA